MRSRRDTTPTVGESPPGPRGDPFIRAEREMHRGSREGQEQGGWRIEGRWGKEGRERTSQCGLRVCRGSQALGTGKMRFFAGQATEPRLAFPLSLSGLFSWFLFLTIGCHFSFAIFWFGFPLEQSEIDRDGQSLKKQKINTRHTKNQTI